MADTKDVGEAEKKDAVATASTSSPKVKKKKGIFSRIWNTIFRVHGDDFEKRLQYISKEEATVLARMKRRSQTWRRMIKHFIIFSVVLEVIAVGYAIATTRSADLNWKMRAFRVLPMFLLPAIFTLSYTALMRFTRMCDRKDQKTLEKLRVERKEKIDELKEKTNYYITQQLIQRYDTDPAAKAAAASVLASKLGAESGLKVFLGEESNPQQPPASVKSNDAEVVPSGGLRNRKQKSQTGTGTGNAVMQQHSGEGMPSSEGTRELEQLVVNHQFPQGPSATDGGWIARVAALLVGEDPTQSFALICGNCHMHNGLVRKEDFPFVTYYCPHCHALNQSEKRVSGSTTPNLPSVRGSDVLNSPSETLLPRDDDPVTASPPEKPEELSETPIAAT